MNNMITDIFAVVFGAIFVGMTIGLWLSYLDWKKIRKRLGKEKDRVWVYSPDGWELRIRYYK